MPNKVTEALGRAANNFKPANVRKVAQDDISVADALKLREPAMSAAQREGINAAGRVAGNRFAEKVLAQEQYQKAKAEYEKARDDALWASIQRRRLAL